MGWLPRREFDLPTAGGVASDDEGASTGTDAIMFTHGFLGSPLDMAHICEALAARGYTVAAPEFGESLCASYANAPPRAEIVAATRELVDGGGAARGLCSDDGLRPGLHAHRRIHSGLHQIYGHET